MREQRTPSLLHFVETKLSLILTIFFLSLAQQDVWLFRERFFTPSAGGRTSDRERGWSAPRRAGTDSMGSIKSNRSDGKMCVHPTRARACFQPSAVFTRPPPRERGEGRGGANARLPPRFRARRLSRRLVLRLSKSRGRSARFFRTPFTASRATERARARASSACRPSWRRGPRGR